MRSMVACSRGMSKYSPQAVRTAGATWTTVILSESARASKGPLGVVPAPAGRPRGSGDATGRTERSPNP